MDAETLSKIHALALKVREWAEEVAVRENFPEDLCGLCARASARLFVVLRNAGYDPALCYSTGHVFVLVYGHIIDVTATQFSVPERVLIKAHGIDEPWWWDTTKVFTDPESLLENQVKSCWAETQQVQLEEIKI